MLFSDFFQSLNTSLIHIEMPLFLSRNTCVQTGAVADDIGGEGNKRAQTTNRMSFFREKCDEPVKTA